MGFEYAEHRAKLLDAVLERSTGKDSRIHGPTHWASVAAAGLTVLDGTPGADPFVVLLFALLHDSMRESDWRDPEHGARAAKVRRLQLRRERYEGEAEPFRKLRDEAHERLGAATAKRLEAVEEENRSRFDYSDANLRVESREQRIKEAGREIRQLRGEG